MRRAALAYAVVVVVFLGVCLIPAEPRAVRDAVDRQIVEGFAAHYSTLGWLSLPFTETLKYLERLGQPSRQGPAWLLWSLAALLAISWIAKIEGGLWRSRARRLALRLADYLAAVAALAFLILFVPLPADRLTAADPDVLLFDLQTHTTYSYDAIATPDENIRFHLDHGFDAWAVTDHEGETGAQETRRRAAALDPPRPVLVGGEYRAWPTRHYLFLGQSTHVEGWYLRRFERAVIDRVHAEGGAAIVVKWWEKAALPVAEEVALGVDAFEILNTSYAVYDPAARRDIIAEADRAGLLLLASNDWHGYGSSSITWNAIRVPGWRAMAAEKVEAEILDRLHRRDRSSIRPLVFDAPQRYGPPRWALEPFFALYYLTAARPFTENLVWLARLTLLFWGIVLARRSPKWPIASSLTWTAGLAICGALALAKGIRLANLYYEYQPYNDKLREFGWGLEAAGALLLAWSAFRLLIVFKAAKRGSGGLSSPGLAEKNRDNWPA